MSNEIEAAIDIDFFEVLTLEESSLTFSSGTGVPGSGWSHFNRKACTKIKYYSQNSTGGGSQILFSIM